MKYDTINSSEIITLNDFPVHNEQILKIYFLIYQTGNAKIIPSTPVMKVGLFSDYLKEKNEDLSNILDDYLGTHSDIKYLMLDGSHKTTAACLNKENISVFVIESDEDIKEAKKWEKDGKLLGFSISELTLDECLENFHQHFNKDNHFQTVEEKTKRMIAKKVIPLYLIDYFETK